MQSDVEILDEVRFSARASLLTWLILSLSAWAAIVTTGMLIFGAYTLLTPAPTGALAQQIRTCPDTTSRPFNFQLSGDRDGITIVYAEGGCVSEVRAFANLAMHLDMPVKIDGPCDSACTLLLHQPNVCWTRRASFGFHAFDNSGRVNYASSQAYLDAFPMPLQAYLLEELGPVDTWRVDRMVRIRGRDLSQILGPNAHECRPYA